VIRGETKLLHPENKVNLPESNLEGKTELVFAIQNKGKRVSSCEIKRLNLFEACNENSIRKGAKEERDNDRKGVYSRKRKN